MTASVVVKINTTKNTTIPLLPTSTSTSSSTDNNPTSPIPEADSPLLRPATKRTPATYENAVRAAAGSTFRHSISGFHGKVFDDDENENMDCSCLPLRAGVRWLRSKLRKGNGDVDVRDGETKGKLSKYNDEGYKLHSLTRKRTARSNTTATTTTTTTTSSSRYKRHAAEDLDLEWKTNVTTRYAGEGRWLPISGVHRHPTNSNTIASHKPATLSRTSTLLHARAASLRTKPLPLPLPYTRNNTSAYQAYALINEQSSLLHDLDRMASMHAQSGNANALVQMETEYVIEQWKARRRSEYRGVERTEVLGWEAMGRVGVL